MHKYLRSVGFSHIESPGMLENILQDVEKNYDEKKIVENSDHSLRVEFSKDYGYDCGITVCGEYDSLGKFYREYYYPYYRGQGGFHVKNSDDLTVERHCDKEAFGGAYDDYSIGITLIFYLINAIEYQKMQVHPLESRLSRLLAFSALSDSGKILFPIQKSKAEKEEKVHIAEKKAKAEPLHSDDGFHFEEFHFDDKNSYAFLAERMKKEDLYSVVSSTFMPCGIECDQYSIIGDIEDVNITRNSSTDERLYQLKVVALNIPVDICINERDLLGIPEPGMRFKGKIWLQGTVE